MSIDVSTFADEVAALLRLEHGDPHRLLGAHESPGGVVYRVFRPEATRVAVIRADRAPLVLARIHEAGLFEGVDASAGQVPRYELEIEYGPGRSFRVHDPYAFLPTLGELDVHLAAEGRHERLWEKLGAHPRTMDGVDGVAFAVWAPNARGVSVVGDFSDWDGRLYPMRRLGASGIWELFVPDVREGAFYKYEIRTSDGHVALKADPYALATEPPPRTASRVHEPHYTMTDDAWCRARAARDPQRQPLSIYEVHLGSWRRDAYGRPLGYRGIAEMLADYVAWMGFTHVELLPVMAHPFGGSWGYQVSGYFAPTARWGSPEDLHFLIEVLHARGIGVIMDWVPAHFPKDDFSLGRFDGTALYEHMDSRLGEHPDWGTYVFNFGRNEVKNFLMASALYWLREYHVDGLRVDAVASMLYRDYSRAAGEWLPNEQGGRENLQAIGFLKELNAVVHREVPGVLMIAEESTAWTGVSRPVYVGGLGFGFKWNMGWMHDFLEYFSKDPVYRRYHHTNLSFGLLYAWSEHFVLPISHDEVVHGKGSLLGKMAGGDAWQKRANLRALFGTMWAHPGRKLIFMGCEIGQWSEWRHDQSLDWHLVDEPAHRGIHLLVRDLNWAYREHPALWEADSNPASFEWLDVDNAHDNVIAFVRRSPTGAGKDVVCVANLSPVVRAGYRVGLPHAGRWTEILNTDSSVYGGGNVGNGGGVQTDDITWAGKPCSAALVLPPLGVIWLEAP